jgi:hypothetical protein
VASKIAPAITYVAAPAFENCFDRTLPFLDRDFQEFMFSVPAEQLIPYGQKTRPIKVAALSQKSLLCARW